MTEIPEGEQPIAAEPAGQVPDIWTLIERSVSASSGTAKGASTGEPPSEEERARSAKGWRRWRRTADVVATAAWLYLITKVFVIDIDATVIRHFAPSDVAVFEYRLLGLVALVILIAAVLWRWKTLLLLGYVLAFPGVVILWKLPRLIYRKRSWIAVIGVINVIAVLLRDLRYNLISKGLAVLAAATIFLTSSRVLLIVAATYVSVLLLWSSIRVVRRTIEPNWFVRTQQQAIDRAVTSDFVTNLTALSDDVKAGEMALLTPAQLTSVTTGLSVSLTLNRVLYLWAYQLQKYRDFGLALFFNAITYVWLFLGAVTAFWLANLAVLKVDPSQYSFADYPSSYRDAPVLHEFLGIERRGRRGSKG